jgi:hypothetical protein
MYLPRLFCDCELIILNITGFGSNMTVASWMALPLCSSSRKCRSVRTRCARGSMLGRLFNICTCRKYLPYGHELIEPHPIHQPRSLRIIFLSISLLLCLHGYHVLQLSWNTSSNCAKPSATKLSTNFAIICACGHTCINTKIKTLLANGPTLDAKI